MAVMDPAALDPAHHERRIASLEHRDWAAPGKSSYSNTREYAQLVSRSSLICLATFTHRAADEIFILPVHACSTPIFLYLPVLRKRPRR